MKLQFSFLLLWFLLITAFVPTPKKEKADPFSRFDKVIVYVNNVSVAHPSVHWAANVITDPQQVKIFKDAFRNFESHHVCPTGWYVVFSNDKGETQSFKVSEECEDYLRQNQAFWENFKAQLDSTRRSPPDVVCRLVLPVQVGHKTLIKTFGRKNNMHLLLFDSELERLPSATLRIQVSAVAGKHTEMDSVHKVLDACIKKLPRKFKVAGSRIDLRSSSPGGEKSLYVYDCTIFFNYGQDLEGITAATTPLELLHCSLPRNYTVMLVCPNKPEKELQARVQTLIPGAGLSYGLY